MTLTADIANAEPAAALDRVTSWIDGSLFALDQDGHRDRPFGVFAHAWLDHPVIELFARAVRAHGERIAVDDGVTRLTYRQAWVVVGHLARRIAAATAPGDLVGVLLPTSAPFPLAMLACLAAGRPVVPMDLHYPQKWIAQVIEDARMRAVIGQSADPEAAGLLPAGLSHIDVATSLRAAYTAGQDVAASDLGISDLAPAAADAPAMVLYTSGSAGRPKGIVNSQRNLLRRVEQYVNAAHISEHDRFLPLSSDCTIAGIRERLAALLSGATLYLADVQRQGARQLAETLERERISMIYAVPALLRSLAQLPDMRPPASLRVVRVGGDAVLGSDVELLRAWLPRTCLIELGYSSTEAPIMQWFVPSDFPTDAAKLPIGYPLAGNQLAILDDDGLPAAPGEVGELVLKSPYVALGRWIGGRCVGDDFPTDPADPACRIQHTGDLVRLRPDGLIDLIGRKDRQIKIRGQRIEPGEIESALMRWPGVADAAVLARRSDNQVMLVAYVTAAAGAPDGLVDQARAHLRETLPPALQPQRIYREAELPRLPSAKLDLKTLQAMDSERAAAEREESRARAALAAGLADETELAVAAIWRQVLRRDDCGLDDDFFDLGGDSLMVIVMMFELETALGVELPVTMIYQAPTIARLAASIRERSEALFSPLVLVRPGERAEAPVFLIHGIGGNVMELFPLGRQIDYAGPIYAVQSRGLDGRAQPNRTIQAMAADYLAEIRQVQPTGPYHFVGYSYGGLVAFELARQAAAAGERVGLLALLDSTTNARQWPLGLWIKRLFRRAWSHVQTLAKLPGRNRAAYLRKVAASLGDRVAWRFGTGSVEQSTLTVAGLPTALSEVRHANIEAAARYRPAFYPGELILAKAAGGGPNGFDPHDIWRNRALSVEVRIVPGDHISMIDGDNGRELAHVLSQALREALHPPPPPAPPSPPQRPTRHHPLSDAALLGFPPGSYVGQ